MEKGFYNFGTPDVKARRIDSRESFSVSIEMTPALLKKLGEAADPTCVICFGNGLCYDGVGGLKMCSCLEVP